MSHKSAISTKAGQNSITARILKAMSLFASVEVIGMVCSIIRTKLVALWIGAAGVGLLGLFNSAVEMLSNLSQLGLRTSGVREIAAASGSMRGRLIYTVILHGRRFALAGTLMTIIASPLLSFIAFGDVSHWPAFAILSVMVACNNIVSSQSAVMQGSGKLRQIAKSTVTAAVISLAVAVPLVYFLRMDSILPLLLTYGTVTALVYTGFSSASRREAVKIPAAEARDLARSMLRLGVYLTVSGTAGWLTSYILMSFLNYSGGEQTMGYYQAGYTITIRYVGVIFTAMALEYFPRLTSVMASGTRRGEPVVRHEMIVSLLVVTGGGTALMLLAPWVVKILYSDSFLPIVPMVILASPGIVLRAASFSLSYSVLAAGRGRAYMIMELTSYAISIATATTGYILWGIKGLGGAFTAWYLIYMVITYMVTRHTTGITPGRKAGLICCGAFLWLCLLATFSLSML